MKAIRAVKLAGFKSCFKQWAPPKRRKKIVSGTNDIVSEDTVNNIIQEITLSQSGVLFTNLHFHKNLDKYDNDVNRADHEYCHLVSRWTGFKSEVIDRIHRKSALTHPE